MQMKANFWKLQAIINNLALLILNEIKGYLPKISHKMKLDRLCNLLFQIYSHTGLNKSHICECYILKIINFTDCHTLLFSNKYIHKHNFSVSKAHEAILRN